MTLLTEFFIVLAVVLAVAAVIGGLADSRFGLFLEKHMWDDDSPRHGNVRQPADAVDAERTRS